MAEWVARISKLLVKNEDDLRSAWTESQLRELGGKISPAELKIQCRDFFGLLVAASAESQTQSIDGRAWDPVRAMLVEVSRSRGQQGFSPGETAKFIFSLKRPMFEMARRECGRDPEDLAGLTWALNDILDSLGLFTTEAYQRTREELISRQQEDLLELSTPVVKLWDGILALPMIGTLDSNRTQIVMETLLTQIMETSSEVAIIDITGVPTVDTLVAQHLIKTVTAARLMGAECIISGIRPQIAATIVHLGVDLGTVITKSSLSDAFALALKRTGRSVRRDAVV